MIKSYKFNVKTKIKKNMRSNNVYMIGLTHTIAFILLQIDKLIWKIHKHIFKIVSTVSNASFRHCCVFLSFNLSSIAVKEISACSMQLDLASTRTQIQHDCLIDCLSIV